MKLLRLWQRATGLWETWFDLTLIRRSELRKLREFEIHYKRRFTEAQRQAIIDGRAHIARNPRKKRELEAA